MPRMKMKTAKSDRAATCLFCEVGRPAVNESPIWGQADRIYYYECPNCGATGPRVRAYVQSDGESIAVRAWNACRRIKK